MNECERRTANGHSPSGSHNSTRQLLLGRQQLGPEPKLSAGVQYHPTAELQEILKRWGKSCNCPRFALLIADVDTRTHRHRCLSHGEQSQQGCFDRVLLSRRLVACQVSPVCLRSNRDRLSTWIWLLPSSEATAHPRNTGEPDTMSAARVHLGLITSQLFRHPLEHRCGLQLHLALQHPGRLLAVLHTDAVIA